MITPTDKWLKVNLQKWLTKHDVEWTISMLKIDLLALCYKIKINNIGFELYKIKETV